MQFPSCGLLSTKTPVFKVILGRWRYLHELIGTYGVAGLEDEVAGHVGRIVVGGRVGYGKQDSFSNAIDGSQLVVADRVRVLVPL